MKIQGYFLHGFNSFWEFPHLCKMFVLEKKCFPLFSKYQHQSKYITRVFQTKLKLLCILLFYFFIILKKVRYIVYMTYFNGVVKL